MIALFTHNLKKNKKDYLASIILMLIVLVSLFSEISRNVDIHKYTLYSNTKIYTKLAYPYIKQITITNYCELANNSTLIIGSFYDGPNYIVNSNKLNCQKNKIIYQNKKIIAEYIEFVSPSKSKVDLIVETHTSREISYLRIILCLASLFILLNYKPKMKVNNIIKKFQTITVILLIIIGLINLFYIIPNWDDGWQFAIINKWLEFGTANNLWSKYNSIFGNWLYLILSYIHQNLSSLHLLRLLSLFIWVISYLVTLKILKIHFHKYDDLLNKILIFLTFSFIMVSVGTTLRFEPYICLFLMLSLYNLLNFLKTKENNDLKKFLVFASLSISLGLAGIMVISLLMISLSKIKYKNVIIIFNFSIFTTILLLLNSNLKLFIEDINSTRILTLRSHNFGFFDEWRRYFGANGIINSYDFSFSIFLVILIFAIFVITKNLFEKNYRVEKINLIFILSLIILSFLPSKWGWYLLPIIPIATLVVIINLKNDNSKWFLVFSFNIGFFLIYKLQNNSIWDPNPSINNEIINYEIVANIKPLFIFIFAILFFVLFNIFTFRFQRFKSFKFFYVSILTFSLIILLIKPIPFLNQFSSSNIYNWSKNSFPECEFINNIEFKEITSALTPMEYQVNKGLQYPDVQQEIFIKGLKRFTTNNKEDLKIELKINPIKQNSTVGFAIRGKDVDKLNIRVEYPGTKDGEEVNIRLPSLSDSSIWQQYTLQDSLANGITVEFFSKNLLTDIQVTSPYFVREINFLSYLESNKKYLHLGPQEFLLGSCLNNPLIVNGKWVDPNFVIGNANSLLNVLQSDNYLKIINTCWGSQEKFDIRNCVVEWHDKQV